MFLNTLGLKHDMIVVWIKNAPAVINQICAPKPPSKQFLVNYFEKLDLVDSHYCRKDSERNYIAATFRTKVDVFKNYKAKFVEKRIETSFIFYLFNDI